MNKETLEKIQEMLSKLETTHANKEEIQEIRKLLKNGEYEEGVRKLTELTKNNKKSKPETKTKVIKEKAETKTEKIEVIEDTEDIEKSEVKKTDKENDIEEVYPKLLKNKALEELYIGAILNDYKLIAKYNFFFEDCYFDDDNILNIYKRILFTEGQAYASERLKKGFNFARNSGSLEALMKTLRNNSAEKKYDIEKVYTEVRKLFELRKHYLQMPVKSIQDKLVEITQYRLYDKMTIEEVESAINQISITNRFKQAVLNDGLSDFLKKGENNLTNGLEIPFNILNYVFKGIRKGETMAFATPSNAGKSRFSINLAAVTAIFHKKKILIISNEMSEEKVRLCLITTIINNPLIKKLHGHQLRKTEGEILEYKYRPDKGAKVELDEEGFILKKEDETQKDFIEKLSKFSSEYNEVIAITDWVNEQMDNSISFMNITDHTNDELKKVIMNYYYKEEVEYVFYDTLKTDINNIGSPEEIKRTATILANLAQTFELFIFSTLQLAESSTLPVNLNVNDLAVSRTVKEVLDTLALVKQIHRDTYDDYEYSVNEVDTKYYDLEKFDDPDVRYYSCVVDKNRAGAKPIVLFRLNLAYNSWEELGFLRLKQGKGQEEA